MNLQNKFTLIGELVEGKIYSSPNYYRSILSININKTTVIDISYFVSRIYSPEKYDNMERLINQIKPKFNGYVLIGNEKYYKLQGNKNRLYVLGNLGTDGKRIYFNANYVEVADEKLDDFIDIRLDGQWIDDSHMLTIQNDRPLVFNIKRVNTGGDIVSCQMAYHSGYDVVEEMICNADGGLFPISFVKIGNRVPDIDKWLLEWSIICDDK